MKWQEIVPKEISEHMPEWISGKISEYMPEGIYEPVENWEFLEEFQAKFLEF